MIVTLYAGLLALLFVFLSLNVIRLRRGAHISLGDGGNDVLQRRIRAQGNLAEYGPLGLLLLFLMETGGAGGLMLHGLALVFVVARCMHAAALTSPTPRSFLRVGGMVATLSVIIVAAFGCILLSLRIV